MSNNKNTGMNHKSTETKTKAVELTTAFAMEITFSRNDRGESAEKLSMLNCMQT